MWEPNGRPEHLRASCEGSLERLKVDRIAVYQLHRPDPAVPLEESLGALVELRDGGKIGHIGICNVTEDELRDAQTVTPIVSVQNRYNLRDRRSEGLIDVCENEGMAFLPWAPIQDLPRTGIVQDVARHHRATPTQSSSPGSWPARRRCCRSPVQGRSITWRRTWRPPTCSWKQARSRR